jgi:hypothetical protein
MVANDDGVPAPVEEKEGDFHLLQTIGAELNHVPDQKQALHKEAVSPDMEGRASLNSLPSIALSGAGSNKYEDEDGVIRRGKWFAFTLPTDPIFLCTPLSFSIILQISVDIYPNQIYLLFN